MIVRGKDKLRGVHPDLVRVIERAARDADFVITEGVRTVERQKKLVAEGASRTMNSRHIPAANGYSHAVDIYPHVGGKTIMTWDGGHFAALAAKVKAAAAYEGVPVEWGGDWKRFKDGPHWQLPHASYPGKAEAQSPRKATVARPAPLPPPPDIPAPEPAAPADDAWWKRSPVLRSLGQGVAWLGAGGTALLTADWKVIAVLSVVGLVLAGMALRYQVRAR